MENKNCFHCGQPVLKAGAVLYDDRSFCCNGCKTVYEIFNASGLTAYYDMQASPGATPIENQHKYDFLDNAAILARLLDFNEAGTAVVTLYVPHIHCSSCIWILENLHKLHPGIIKAQVDFPKKRVRITFSSEETTIKDIVLMLCRMGYEPYISLEDYTSEKTKRDYTPLIKLGVAFFSFGNIMLLSFPEYFEVGEFWLDQYKGFFRLLIFLLAMPSFLYAASGYYVAAWKSVRTGFLSIEVPIALGIIVMFVRSVADMLLNHGPGFFDSMTGLIFFMLLGKAFQSRSYAFLNFERDYKSYFPVAVSRLKKGTEETVPVYDIEKGDRLLVRNQEIIPCDGILISAHAMIDYSFVTGESQPVPKVSGDHIFAGGRQRGAVIEMEALQPVSQSYLTQLWSNEVFNKKRERALSSLTNRASRYFTPLLLLTAVAGFGFWMFTDMGIAFSVFTAVLIVACPCALALSAPFTLGNIIRILGRRKFYLKDASVVEDLASVDTIVFDKTGTLTVRAAKISYQGSDLSNREMLWLRSALRPSNHPLSRALFEWLPDDVVLHPEQFEEIPGGGIEAVIDDRIVRVGSGAFTGGQTLTGTTCVHVSIDGKHIGCYAFANRYRDGLAELMAQLGKRYKLAVLSGDNDGEREPLRRMFPEGTQFRFNQNPEDKLAFIKKLQESGSRVAMVGDGLNDAGALAQSDVGISVAEDINIFSPACDAILDAAAFGKLPAFFRLSEMALNIIRLSFGISILYNFGGLAFALTGKLDPIVAAIAMPLSTVTIVAVVTVSGNIAAWISGVSQHRETLSGQRPGDMTNIIFSPKAAA